MAAARWCSHRGGWKVDFPAAREIVVASGKMLAGGGSGGVGSCHGCSWCGCFVAVGNTEPKYGRKPPRFLLRIEEFFLPICFLYFLLTCHDVTNTAEANTAKKTLVTERA